MRTMVGGPEPPDAETAAYSNVPVYPRPEYEHLSVSCTRPTRGTYKEHSAWRQWARYGYNHVVHAYKEAGIQARVQEVVLPYAGVLHDTYPLSVDDGYEEEQVKGMLVLQACHIIYQATTAPETRCP